MRLVPKRVIHIPAHSSITTKLGSLGFFGAGKDPRSIPARTLAVEYVPKAEISKIKVKSELIEELGKGNQIKYQNKIAAADPHVPEAGLSKPLKSPVEIA